LDQNCLGQRGSDREIFGGVPFSFFLSFYPLFVLPDLLCSLPNVVCTGQTGWYSPDSCRELREAAAHEVRRALVGAVPEDLKVVAMKYAKKLLDDSPFSIA
jgi:hypothetical protein